MTKVEQIINSIRSTLKEFTKPEQKIFIDNVNRVVVRTVLDSVHINMMHIFITLYDDNNYTYYDEHFYYHPNIDITMAPIIFTINRYYKE